MMPAGSRRPGKQDARRSCAEVLIRFPFRFQSVTFADDINHDFATGRL
jgi:hypothetical protein